MTNWRNPAEVRAYARKPNSIRPKSYTREGRSLSTFLAHTPKFKAELKELRPDWFVSDPTLAVEDIPAALTDFSEETVIDVFSRSTKTRPFRTDTWNRKIEYLQLAVKGEPRPRNSKVLAYVSDDPAFGKIIEIVRSDWLVRQPYAPKPLEPVHGPEVQGAAMLRKPRNHPNQKLSDADYTEILERYQALKSSGEDERGFFSHTAQEFGVSTALVYRIIKRAFLDQPKQSAQTAAQ